MALGCLRSHSGKIQHIGPHEGLVDPGFGVTLFIASEAVSGSFRKIRLYRIFLGLAAKTLGRLSHDLSELCMRTQDNPRLVRVERFG